MNKCPNVNTPEWKEMVKELGTKEAYKAFLADIPDLVTYRKVSDIQLQGWKSYTVDPALSFSDAYNDISAKKKELVAQGAQIKNTTDTGFLYQLPENYLSADVSDNGKLTNIKFPLDNRGQSVYSTLLGKAISDTTKSPYVVQPSQYSDSNITNRSSEQSLPGTGTGKDDRTFEQLFDSYKRGDRTAISGLSNFIASRLLQKSDSFIGRVADSLFKDRGLGSFRVFIDSESDKPSIYTYKDGIHINTANLHELLDNYTTPEDLQKAVEIILTEEVIHGVMFATSDINEINKVFSEMTPAELASVSKIYNFGKTPTADHVTGEYIRMIVQAKNFDTITELHTKHPALIQAFINAIRYIINVFKGKPTGAAKAVVDKMQAFIDASRNNNTYYQLNNDKEVKALPRTVDIANTPKAKSEWNKLQKGNITIDQFLQNAQFPKEQKELLKSIYEKDKPTSLNDLITSFVADYSYTVEIETAKTRPVGTEEPNEFFDNEEGGQNTQHYSNLTVPGGTNYTENEIKTPSITPSIKGHAQFSTESGIGWFRSDAQMLVKDTGEIDEPYYNDEEGWINDNTKKEHIATKTRRILELQSDYGQKQRKSVEPDIHIKYNLDDIINKLKQSGELKIIC